jgi:hypothetical protein
MFAGHAVFSRTATVHNFLPEEAVALDGVGIATASAYLVLPELNHADFRVKGFRILDCPVKFCGFEVEHWSLLLEFVSITDLYKL